MDISLGGRSAFVEIWLLGLTCAIYTGIIMHALIFVEAMTECHCSVNAPDIVLV